MVTINSVVDMQSHFEEESISPYNTEHSKARARKLAKRLDFLRTMDREIRSAVLRSFPKDVHETIEILERMEESELHSLPSASTEKRRSIIEKYSGKNGDGCKKE